VNYMHWHPMMVHFPLALTLTGFLCLLLARLLRQKSVAASLAACGTWNLVIAGIASLLTLATGLAAAWHLQLHGAMQHSVSAHVVWAICTSQLVSLLGMWRAFAGSPERSPSTLFLALVFAACLACVATGYYGGENVYHYGIGVRPADRGSIGVVDP
jgi:uncharacterized membrane protein